MLKAPARAIASKIQPIGLRGTLHASTRPTTANGAIGKKIPSPPNVNSCANAASGTEPTSKPSHTNPTTSAVRGDASRDRPVATPGSRLGFAFTAILGI